MKTILESIRESNQINECGFSRASYCSGPIRKKQRNIDKDITFFYKKPFDADGWNHYEFMNFIESVAEIDVEHPKYKLSEHGKRMVKFCKEVVNSRILYKD